MKTGSVILPLHSGSCPRWLFLKMKEMAKQLIVLFVEEFGTEELLKRLADPLWFQSFGCVLGFDWHSSGLTTTVCAAIKEGISKLSDELTLYVCGGKGARARETPREIAQLSPAHDLAKKLIYASKLAAKIDNAALFDGYQLYHHSFIFNQKGQWVVIQQGLNERHRFARRYHWLFLNQPSFSFTQEPHYGIISHQKQKRVLNLVAKESQKTQKTVIQVATEKPEKLINDFQKIQTFFFPLRYQLKTMSQERLYKIFQKTYQLKPQNFEALLTVEGVGPKTIFALSLISMLIYGAKPSFQDPALFSWTFGGKDGIPYPVDKENYLRSIEVLKLIIQKARLGNREKLEAFRRLNQEGLN